MAHVKRVLPRLIGCRLIIELVKGVDDEDFFLGAERETSIDGVAEASSTVTKDG
jgi:hypothetical protein